MAAVYPTGVTILVDGVDITKYIFGTETLELSDIAHIWRDIDISTFIHSPGLHTLEVKCISGVGRVEARLEID